jgi:hypothetical protein
MTNNMETPAHWAAALGRVAVLEILIAHSAGLDVRDGTANQTPLEKAKTNNHIEVIRLLEDKQKIERLHASRYNRSAEGDSAADAEKPPVPPKGKPPVTHMAVHKPSGWEVLGLLFGGVAPACCMKRMKPP